MTLQSVARRVLAGLPYGPRTALLHRFGRYAPWEEGFDFTAPALGPGEVAGAPEFVGIGVQKAGTTWWYRLIAEHPGVSDRSDLHKERHFFDRYATRSFGAADAEAYQSWFPRSSGTIAGEWTPDYFEYRWVPELLRRSAPECRLLLMLRDPVERFVSGLAHQLRNGGRHTGTTMSEALNRGLYNDPLRRWSSLWEADRLLVLQYERCVSDPEKELERTYDFLGLDNSFRPMGLHMLDGNPTNDPESPRTDPAGRADPRRSRVGSVRQTGSALQGASARGVVLEPEARKRLVEIYLRDVTLLKDAVPDLDLSLWPNFRDTASP